MTTPIQQLCLIPRDYRDDGRSLTRLVHDSGIRKNPDALEEQKLVESLRADPALVEDWLDFAADNRKAEGWFLIKERPDLFVVGTAAGARLEFSDAAAACATFIVHALTPLVHRTPFQRLATMAVGASVFLGLIFFASAAMGRELLDISTLAAAGLSWCAGFVLMREAGL
jgi:hypothetical protein